MLIRAVLCTKYTNNTCILKFQKHSKNFQFFFIFYKESGIIKTVEYYKNELE